MNRLRNILAWKRREIAAAKRLVPEKLLKKLIRETPSPLDFAGRIRRGKARNNGSAPGKIRLIAEIKRSSPSAGGIAPAADAVSVARKYAGGGASALSVLTDARFFNGSLSDLARVRQAVAIPLLRKDFILDEYQLLEARAAGADAVLLIAAALGPRRLQRMARAARALRLQTLVEIHDPAELRTALRCRPDALGVNRRDLRSFRIRPDVVEKILPQIPAGVPVVAESGIRGEKDVRYFSELGVDAVLIGEFLMRRPDPAAAVRRLLS